MYLALIFLLEAMKDALISCVRSFCKAGSYKPAHQFLHLGLIAAILLVVPYAHLCMRPVQWYRKDWWSSPLGLNHRVFMNADLVRDLQWWTVESNLLEGRPFMPASHTVGDHGC